MAVDLETIRERYESMDYVRRQNCPQKLTQDNIGTCSSLSAAAAQQISDVGGRAVCMVDWYDTSFHSSAGQLTLDSQNKDVFERLNYHKMPHINVVRISPKLASLIETTNLMHPAKVSGSPNPEEDQVDLPKLVVESKVGASNALIGCIPDPADYLMRLAEYRYSNPDNRT